MSLIDENNNNNKENKCIVCNNIFLSSFIFPLCQNCFEKDVKKSLKLIEKQLNDFVEKQKQINNLYSKLNDEISKNKNIELKYKYQMDLLNLEATKRKIEIDIEINKKALELNKEHAKEIKTKMNWK
ncbi:MAG: hypothetical protein IKJ72_00490 [Mycoplasmataceae bacterium]|nr:hypothetical protein [Mycoplasmataceae bacterium]